MVDPRADAVVDEAMPGLHPTEGPLNVALSRIAALEDRVEALSRRVAALIRVVDLLVEQDGA